MIQIRMFGLIILLFCLSSSVTADQEFVGFGKINFYEIQMYLTISDDGFVEGEYSYQNYQIPIPIKGFLKNDNIRLKTVGNVVEEEEFIGSLRKDASQVVYISGHWFVHSDGFDSKKMNDFYVASDDPFEDQYLTCREMYLYPELVFKNFVDLGSGYSSSLSFDHKCPNSINNLTFLSDFLEQSDYVRLPSRDHDAKCNGSISRVYRRYYEFDLAKLGYFPQSGDFQDIDNNPLYFESWSYKSLFNRGIFLKYQELKAHAKNQLAHWYLSEYQIDAIQAEKYAEAAIRYIDKWAYGWGRQSVVGLLEGTKEAIQGNSELLLETLSKFSKYDYYADLYRSLNTLSRLIIHNAPIELVTQVVQRVQPKMGIPSEFESPLSLSVRNEKMLGLLIESGFDVNNTNSFGKTPLFYAIQYGSYESILLLLNAGAIVNHSYDKNLNNAWCTRLKSGGKTPLMHAAQHADVKALQLLIDHEADISAKDENGYTAHWYAVQSKNIENIMFLSTKSTADNRK